MKYQHDPVTLVCAARLIYGRNIINEEERSSIKASADVLRKENRCKFCSRNKTKLVWFHGAFSVIVAR